MSESWRWRPELLSVVVPTYRRGEVLTRVLEGLAGQTLPVDRFEVIVVDDGSPDDTPARLAAFQVNSPFPLTALRQENSGPAAARNAGLARARGQVVLFLDDDCIPDPSLLAEHVASHETEGLAVIGHIAWHPDVPQTPFMAFAEPRLLFSYDAIKLPFDATFACFYTGNASVHRASALAEGGFDETFRHATMEDIEFAYRLRRQGVRFVYNAAARVGHYRTADLASTLTQMRVRGREAVRLWIKHPELTDFVPVTEVVDPTVRTRFYEALTGYYLALGVQDGLAATGPLDSTEVMPPALPDDLRWTVERRLGDLQAEVRDLRAQESRLRLEIAHLRSDRSALSAAYARLEGAYTTVQAAFAEQAAWAQSLVAQVETKGAAHPRPPLPRALRRLWGRWWGHGAGAGGRTDG